MTAVTSKVDLSTKKSALHSLQESFKKVFEEDLDRPIESARIAQIALSERNYLYMQGKQYLVPKPDINSRTIGWRSAWSPTKGSKQPRFASIYNDIQGDGVKFIAVVAQQPPNLKAVADDPGDIASKQAAKVGDMGIRHLHRGWDMRAVTRQIAFHLWVTGTAFLHPRYVSDGYRYGFTEEPVVDVESMTEPSGYRCPECGTKGMGLICPECARPLGPETFEGAVTVEVPAYRGTKKFANGAVELNVCSSLYVTVPFGVDCLEKVDFLSWRTMQAAYQLRGLYGKSFESETSTGTLDQATAEVAQDIESPTGIDDTTKGRLVHERRWITPAVYHAFPLAQRRALMQQFPEGVMVARIGDQYVDIEGRKLIHDWTACTPGTGEYLESYPLAHYLISIQDDTNSMTNMGKEITLRSIPRTVMDSSIIDIEKWKERPPMVGDILFARMSSTQNLGNMIKDLPRADFPPELLGLLGLIAAKRQEIGGIQPVLFGGAGQKFSTWRASAQAKNMALMQLGPTMQNIHWALAGATMNGIRQLERFGTGQVLLPPARHASFSRAQRLDLQELTSEGWHIEPVEGIPMSYGEKVQQAQELVAENPMVAGMVGFNSPVNSAQVQEMFGMPELISPTEVEREAALELIEQLLGEVPVDDIDMMTGAPTQVPSIQPDPFEQKNYVLWADIFRTWCLSEIGRQQKRENPAGYTNVKLFGVALDQAAAAQMAAQAMAAGAAPPGGPPAPAGDGKEPSPLAPVETNSTGPIPPVEEGL